MEDNRIVFLKKHISICYFHKESLLFPNVFFSPIIPFRPRSHMYSLLLMIATLICSLVSATDVSVGDTVCLTQELPSVNCALTIHGKKIKSDGCYSYGAYLYPQMLFRVLQEKAFAQNELDPEYTWQEYTERLYGAPREALLFGLEEWVQAVHSFLQAALSGEGSAQAHPYLVSRWYIPFSDSHSVSSTSLSTLSTEGERRNCGSPLERHQWCISLVNPLVLTFICGDLEKSKELLRKDEHAPIREESEWVLLLTLLSMVEYVEYLSSTIPTLKKALEEGDIETFRQVYNKVRDQELVQPFSWPFEGVHFNEHKACLAQYFSYDGKSLAYRFFQEVSNGEFQHYSLWDEDLESAAPSVFADESVSAGLYHPVEMRNFLEWSAMGKCVRPEAQRPEPYDFSEEFK